VTDLSRELLDRLRQAGYEFVRHGKGSDRQGSRHPHKIPSRHFANKLLRDAGLPKAF
jgi:hypothetical protein